MNKILLISILFLVFAMNSFAGTYYVDNETASTTWGTCTDIGTPCTRYTANVNATAGDTIYFRGGNYTVDNSTTRQGIYPYNTGSEGSKIIYSNYNDEVVNFIGADQNGMVGVYLRPYAGTTLGYIKISGINFSNMYRFLVIDGRSSTSPYADIGTNYIEVSECTFTGVRYSNNDGVSAFWKGSSIDHNSTHNWIHDNTFHTYGAYTAADVGVVFELGQGISALQDESNNNTIENNEMYSGGHHVIGVNTGIHNVIRNNYFHNESWWGGGDCADELNGVCGYRVMSMTAGDVAWSGNQLVEDNIISYGAQFGGPHLGTGGSGSGVTVGTPSNIVRYNSMFNNAMFGMRTGSSISGAGDNRVYNNTFYHNGYGADDDAQALDSYRGGFSLYLQSCLSTGNVVKNNLFYDHWSEDNLESGTTYYPALYAPNATVLACNTLEHNYVDNSTTYLKSAYSFSGSADPKFVDPDVSDPTALSFVGGEWTGEPDLSLQSTSPAINGATFLTQSNGSGTTSKTIIVDDASYFQDGTWGSSLATLNADFIAIGTVSNISEIDSIDYDNNTITLADDMTWSDDASIWLSKKSDGDIVLSGAAPDYGAFEYEDDNDTATSTPTIVSPDNGTTDVAVTTSITWADRNTGADTGDADFYDVWFDAGNATTKVVDNSTVLTYDPSGDLDNSETYYWKVLARNDNNTSTSDVWEFTTIGTGLGISKINDGGGLTTSNINDGNLSVSNVM